MAAIVFCYPNRLMLGVMLVTMFLSMWINNGAATSMILPIVDVLTKQIFGQVFA